MHKEKHWPWTAIAGFSDMTKLKYATYFWVPSTGISFIKNYVHLYVERSSSSPTV